jgi:hypothetical protein
MGVKMGTKKAPCGASTRKTLFLLKKITTPWRGLLLGKHRIYRSLGCQSVPSKIMSSRSPFMKMLVMVSRSFLLFLHI